MDSQYWKQKWEKGETQFHLDAPHPMLVRYFSKAPARKVMVPLCGKSNDLVWLRAQGHEVVGVELSALACEAFFTENKIAFQKRQVGSAVVFQGERVTLWCGDFFEIPKSAWEGCTAVYDRAALIALPEEIRAKYARHIIQNVTQSSMLLVTVEYQSGQLIGPPYSVSEEEIHSLYGKSFEIERLESRRDEGLSNRPPKFTGIEVTEKVFRLTQKK